jgi:hypothetical protein
MVIFVAMAKGQQTVEDNVSSCRDRGATPVGRIVGGIGGQGFVEEQRLMLIGSCDIGELATMEAADTEILLWLEGAVCILAYVLFLE